MRQLYAHGLFFKRKDAVEFLRLGYDFASKYVAAADMALRMGRTRFKLSPKLHALYHILQYVQDDLANTQASFIRNPVTYSTQQDEDFVGRVAALSTAVASRTMHAQTMARYAINFWNHWGDWSK